MGYNLEEPHNMIHHLVSHSFLFDVSNLQASIFLFLDTCIYNTNLYGSDVAIALNANIADLASAASGITIAGATVVVDGSYLKITSASTGTSSTITIKSDSGQTDRDRDKSINRSRW